MIKNGEGSQIIEDTWYLSKKLWIFFLNHHNSKLFLYISMNHVNQETQKIENLGYNSLKNTSLVFFNPKNIFKKVFYDDELK